MRSVGPSSVDNMNRRKLEALAEAVVAYSGYLQPDSALHAARNPGGLKALGATQSRDDKGNRTFRSVLDGYQALLYDVELKVAGIMKDGVLQRSRARLTPDHTLMDLSAAYNLPITTASAWSRFLRQALSDSTISAKTPLSYFLES